MKRYLVPLLACALLLGAAMPALAQEPVASVDTPVLNVRSGPGLQYGAILNVPQGFGVRMLARNFEGNWIFIELADGRRGWVNVNYIYTTYRTRNLPINTGGGAQPSPIVPTAQVKGVLSYELFAGASFDAAVVGFFPAGDVGQLIGRDYSGAWALVRSSGGTQGWILARNISTSVPVRSVSPADGSVYAPPPPANRSTTNTSSPQPAQSNSASTHYTVQRGDTLSDIAEAFGTTVNAIARANGIVNVNHIYYGTQLHIP